MSDSLYYDGIDDFRETDVNQARTLVQTGEWVLLKPVERVSTTFDANGNPLTNSDVVYVMGHKRQLGKPPPSQTAPEKPPAPQPAAKQSASQPSAPTKTAPQGNPSKCRYCSGEIFWVKRDGKNVATNRDSSDHSVQVDGKWTCKPT